MEFSDHKFPEVLQKLSLQLRDARLYTNVAALTVAENLLNQLRDDIPLALAINTEKARSEFIIAPVLAHLRRMMPNQFSLFSGVELNVDASQGLNGVCDFVLSLSPIQMMLTAPIVAITEAKNDTLSNGFGQCIASMVAAREFNTPKLTHCIYGVVTTGTAWKFMKLEQDKLTIDRDEYYITDVAKILGILASMVQPAKV